MIIDLILLIILIALAVAVFKFILDLSSTALKLIVHILSGWIFLTIANFIPGIHIPINIITALISGIGGVTGTILLAIFYLLF